MRTLLFLPLLPTYFTSLLLFYWAGSRAGPPPRSLTQGSVENDDPVRTFPTWRTRRRPFRRVAEEAGRNPMICSRSTRPREGSQHPPNGGRKKWRPGQVGTRSRELSSPPRKS